MSMVSFFLFPFFFFIYFYDRPCAQRKGTTANHHRRTFSLSLFSCCLFSFFFSSILFIFQVGSTHHLGISIIGEKKEKKKKKKIEGLDNYWVYPSLAHFPDGKKKKEEYKFIRVNSLLLSSPCKLFTNYTV